MRLRCFAAALALREVYSRLFCSYILHKCPGQKGF